MKPGLTAAIALVVGGAPMLARAQAAPAADDAERQLAAQQEEIARLQQQIADRQIERQRLGQVVGELQSLNDRIAAGQAAAEQRNLTRDRELAGVGQAVLLLRSADATLATGDSDVGDTLDAAASILTGPALLYVNGARDAIANSDLHSARLDIQSALTAAENNTVIGTGQPNANP